MKLAMRMQRRFCLVATFSGALFRHLKRYA